MKTKSILSLASAGMLVGTMAFAAPIIPNYDTFGSFPAANFGGTGIDNGTVAAVTKIVPNNTLDTIVLALTATPRYSNPVLGNNGHGTFYATPGLNDGLTSPGHLLGTTWSFNYYLSVNNSAISDYTFQLFYGTDAGSMVAMTPGPVTIAQLDGGLAYTTVGDTTIAQNSENLGFSFLGTPIGFNPYANGVYGFELVAFDAATGQQLGETAINVNVSSVPDGGMTVMLLGAALSGLGLVRMKFVA